VAIFQVAVAHGLKVAWSNYFAIERNY